jgi:hypothetical protein
LESRKRERKSSKEKSKNIKDNIRTF